MVVYFFSSLLKNFPFDDRELLNQEKWVLKWKIIVIFICSRNSIKEGKRRRERLFNACGKGSQHFYVNPCLCNSKEPEFVWEFVFYLIFVPFEVGLYSWTRTVARLWTQVLDTLR